MKATAIIIAAGLYFQVSVYFADNNETRSTVNNEAVFCPSCVLAPVTPADAAFEEVTDLVAFSLDFLFLAPAIPEEADFSDFVTEQNFDLAILAPVTPAEADFNDAIEDQVFDLSALAPATPAVADFE